ncbi:unnamed protein product [Urochloa humidicola]
MHICSYSTRASRCKQQARSRRWYILGLSKDRGYGLLAAEQSPTSACRFSALDAETLRAAAAAIPELDGAGTAVQCSSEDDGGGASPAMVAPAGVPVVLWGDEGRMKQELVAWAKAVASMVVRDAMHC